jgi:hypothetical protein
MLALFLIPNFGLGAIAPTWLGFALALGVPWGVGGGLVVGGVNGLVLALLVPLGRVARPPARPSRRVFGLVGALTTLGALWAIQWGTGRIYQLPRDDGSPLSYQMALWVQFILQVIGAAAGSWWAGRRVGRWANAEIAARAEE